MPTSAGSRAGQNAECEGSKALRGATAAPTRRSRESAKPATKELSWPNRGPIPAEAAPLRHETSRQDLPQRLLARRVRTYMPWARFKGTPLVPEAMRLRGKAKGTLLASVCRRDSIRRLQGSCRATWSTSVKSVRCVPLRGRPPLTPLTSGAGKAASILTLGNDGFQRVFSQVTPCSVVHGMHVFHGFPDTWEPLTHQRTM
jgi:hypothetical protein